MLQRILLVDDDPGLRGIFWMVLAEAGYVVTEAASVAHALEILGADASDVDLIISDNRMAGLPGVELLRAVRARRPDLPMIGISGAGLEPEVLADPALAGVRWVLKPVMPERLLAEVAALIGPARQG